MNPVVEFVPLFNQQEFIMKNLSKKIMLLILLSFTLSTAHASGGKKPPPNASNVESIQLFFIDLFKKD